MDNGNEGPPTQTVSVSEIEGVAPPRERAVLPKIAPQQWIHIDALMMRESKDRWGDLKNQAEHDTALQQWCGEMQLWFNRLGQQNNALRNQTIAIIHFLSPTAVIDSETVDWQIFHSSLSTDDPDGYVADFIKRLETMPAIKENIKGAKILCGIFGKEVRKELFGEYGPAEAHDKRTRKSKELVDKALHDDKVDQNKHEKLTKAIDKRAEDVDYLVHSIEIDSRFTADQKHKLQAILRYIPPALLKNISRISVKKGGGGIHITNPDFRSEIGIDPAELLRDHHGAELTMFHEIMGHGLRNFVYKISKKSFHRELNALLNNSSADGIDLVAMIQKDTYARRFLNEKIAITPDRMGVRNFTDEFWANRMAEWWFKKSTGQKEGHFWDHNNPFTTQEEAYINMVCRAAFVKFEQAAQFKKEKEAARSSPLRQLLGI
ncbi:hypothetical protein KC726_02790 [Candidatus Woesebacteria bacterium]|nr:hypothetical protein [Candidatus Woesebacteria bacterium]